MLSCSPHATPQPPPPGPQGFDRNNNDRVDAGEWAAGLGDLGATGEGAKK